MSVESKSPLRILRVLSTLNPSYGGPAESARTMTAAFRALGHHVELACLDDPRADFLTDLPCPVAALGPGHLGKYGYSTRFSQWLLSNLHRFDLVMISGIYQYHSLATYRACRRVGTPYVVLPHGALDPWFRRRYPIKQMKKWLYWPWADYRVLRDAARVCFTTVEESLLAPQSFWLYSARPAIIGYGTARPPVVISDDEEFFRRAYPRLANRRFLLFLSRIDRKKGCDLLIEGFARAARLDPELMLMMAGPDTSGWQADLERLAEELNISDRIVWAGPLGGKQKWTAYHRADAFILTSHSENFGIVVVEALASGLPTLITDKVNIWKDVVESGAGLAAPDTLNGAELLITRWIQMPTEERNLMRKAARETFLLKFDIQTIAQGIIDQFRLILSERRHSSDHVINQ